MAFTTTAVVAAVAVGFGASELIQGMNDTPDSPPAPGTLPDANKAQVNAKNQLMDQRKTLLASGGQTDYTAGTGVLTGTDVSKTTLLGG